jgi:hypothetical protein
LRVLAAGTPNPGDGPDFLGATLLIDEIPVRGDVEFHFDSTDWFAHGHNADDRYRNVVLHVVLDHTTSGFGVRRDDRTWIATVELRRSLRSSLGGLLRALAASGSSVACPLPPHSPSADERERLVGDLSESRFLRKSERSAERTSLVGEDSAFYGALADALGYAENRVPFAKLVERVSLRTLSRLDVRHAEVCLLGAAGLLPSMRGVYDPSPYVAELEARWRELADPPVTMSGAEWRSSPVRGANRPARRVVALARLTFAFGGRFLDGLESVVLSGEPGRGWRERWKALEVVDDGYWACHSDFGEPSGRRMTALVGESRSRDIWINVVLPAFLARADARRDGRLRERVVALYRAHPALQRNAKTAWVERHVLPSDSVPNARRQQGALELHDAYCEPRRCHDCPLARHSAETASLRLREPV